MAPCQRGQTLAEACVQPRHWHARKAKCRMPSSTTASDDLAGLVTISAIREAGIEYVVAVPALYTAGGRAVIKRAIN